ncbi:hypothetical protein ASE00_12810 [Sphingomonas sp. Root710]|uniref:hypothetical protein n=1 Tax=Sphingomonas sp. Root710 TaxID=1736594 RepID=UPI0006F71250|nr:hypothetical protein [Sphingomonas sp. Root710]KRB82880.1 hypothetical protein ASE00_12810 [Sphingomonas sp. Root710]
METEELLAKMRGRVEQCRRLARAITDQKAVDVLNQMADEGEADIARLIAENGPRARSGDAN